MKEYVDGDKQNVVDSEDSEDWFENIDLTQPGLDIEKLKKSASGINVTPFVWDHNGKEINMNFISGFAGATLTKDKFVKAKFAWGVAENEEAPIAPKKQNGR